MKLIALCVLIPCFVLPPKKVVKKKAVRRAVVVRKIDPLIYRVKSGAFESFAQGSFR